MFIGSGIDLFINNYIGTFCDVLRCTIHFNVFNYFYFFLQEGIMSSPLINPILPPAGTPSPSPAGPVPPMSLSVTSIKPTLPVPAMIKPQTNHTVAAPISLVQEKAKTPEKTKDIPAALPKPTLNGVEETPAAVAAGIACSVPDESPAPPAPAAAVIPPAVAPTVASPPAATPTSTPVNLVHNLAQ